MYLQIRIQNEADKSILTFKFVFVLVAKSTQQKPKAKTIFKNDMLRNKLIEQVFDLPASFWCGLEGIMHGVYKTTKKYFSDQPTLSFSWRETGTTDIF